MGHGPAPWAVIRPLSVRAPQKHPRARTPRTPLRAPLPRAHRVYTPVRGDIPICGQDMPVCGQDMPVCGLAHPCAGRARPEFLANNRRGRVTKLSQLALKSPNRNLGMSPPRTGPSTRTGLYATCTWVYQPAQGYRPPAQGISTRTEAYAARSWVYAYRTGVYATRRGVYTPCAGQKCAHRGGAGDVRTGYMGGAGRRADMRIWGVGTERGARIAARAQATGLSLSSRIPKSPNRLDDGTDLSNLQTPLLLDFRDIVCPKSAPRTRSPPFNAAM